MAFLLILTCMRTHLTFTRLNTTEAMYGRSRVPEEVEPRSTFTRGLSYIASVLFTRVDLRAYARKSYETVDIHCNT